MEGLWNDRDWKATYDEVDGFHGKEVSTFQHLDTVSSQLHPKDMLSLYFISQGSLEH